MDVRERLETLASELNDLCADAGLTEKPLWRVCVDSAPFFSFKRNDVLRIGKKMKQCTKY
jgi:hypothetical protein